MKAPIQGDMTRKTCQETLLKKKAEIRISLGINLRELADAEQRLGADLDKIAHEEYVRIRVNRVLEGQLHLIEDALERLTVGEYGICEDCGAVIPAKRLLAIPWARFCIACQEQAASFSVSELVGIEKEC